MTVDGFIAKWRAAELKESSAAQEHFIDLCRLLGEPTPAEADPTGDSYCFERGATKSTGGNGWADVWKRGHFGWEYKGKRKDLTAAFAQLQQYALALENPPLLVVCDLERFVIRTNWTNTVSETHEIGLDDLRDAAVREQLKAVMSKPEQLRPGMTRAALTERAAGEFARLARKLRDSGHDGADVAHFVNRLVFCMFAEDVSLLPNMMFSRMLDAASNDAASFEGLASTLFGAMHAGAMVGFEAVERFNGGLFDDGHALPLDQEDIALCRRIAALDWSEIDPSILGTLFERGLDPEKRAQLGAHYTDHQKIMMIVEPVITRPWLRKWDETRATIVATLEKNETAKSPAARERTRARAQAIYVGHLEALREYRVLDPACGSGNFLSLALRALKDLEHRAGLDAETLGLQRAFPQVGPESVLGIELNPYAAELARVTVWIGEIQWMRRNGFDVSRNPILKPLDTISCADAVLTESGDATAWPAANAIIGNPPFLGGKMLRANLGDAYVDRLFAAYAGVVPAEADLVGYWVTKASGLVLSGHVNRVGLVATNSIRGGANRRTLEAIASANLIFEAWSDEPWVVDGAAVRVSLVCFGQSEDAAPHLDGEPVPRVAADLTGTGSDLTRAARLAENAGVAFMGDTKGGPFDVPGSLAREWLTAPLNPNGRPNSDVLKPWINGMDVVRRPADKWIVDFGWAMSVEEAALYAAPFAHAQTHVLPAREGNKRKAYADNWWRHVEPRQGMWRALESLTRYVATPTVAKHRVFAWISMPVCPDHQLIVIARDDDLTFGILHSRFHEAWSLRMGTSLGVGNDPRYTPSTTFETFPFPAGLTPDVALPPDDPRAAPIAAAAARLDELRRAWLAPADLVTESPEVVAGFPNRILAKDDDAAKLLAKRTLTALYNERPAWLAQAHAALDAAVAAAYGWPADIATQDALARLLAMNVERSR